MIAQCNVTCGSYGAGFVALDRLVEIVDKIMWIGAGLVGAWMALVVVVAIVRKCRGK